MSVTRENFVIIAVAVVAVVLQIALSPYIQVFGATPNIIAAYVIVVSVVRPTSHRVVVLAFILGLCYNLFQGGPVGALALVLTAVAYVTGRAMALLDNDTAFMPIALAAVGLLLTELAYGLVLMAMGLSAGIGDVLLLRVLPCTVYDVIVALAWWFFMSRTAAEPSANIPPIDGPTLLR